MAEIQNVSISTSDDFNYDQSIAAFGDQEYLNEIQSRYLYNPAVNNLPHQNVENMDFIKREVEFFIDGNNQQGASFSTQDNLNPKEMANLLLHDQMFYGRIRILKEKLQNMVIHENNGDTNLPNISLFEDTYQEIRDEILGLQDCIRLNLEHYVPCRCKLKEVLEAILQLKPDHIYPDVPITGLRNHMTHIVSKLDNCSTVGNNFICAGSTEVDLESNMCTAKSPEEVEKIAKKGASHLGRRNGYLKICIGSRKYKCTVCNRSFRLKRILQAHSKLHTNSKTFDKSGSENTGKRKRRRQRTDNRVFKCEECDTIFLHRSSLKRHMSTHTGEKPHNCEICGKFFSRNSNMQIHMRIHTGEKPFKCEVCEKTFRVRSTMQAHMNSHNEDKTYQCYVCNKLFHQQSQMQRHMKIHKGCLPYKCSVCDKTFRNNCGMQTHMRIHTGDKPYKCNDCGMTFSDKSNLQRHRRIHTGVKPYKCNECGKVFSDNSNRRRHMRKHTGIKPFKCSLCEKEFSQQSSLQKHIRNHTGDRPYECYMCGKSYFDHQEIQIHMRVHTGDRPFSCTLCDKKFSRQSNLQKHMRVHRGDKPFACHMCPKRFNRHCNLQRHIRVHTGDKPYNCYVCNKAFSDPSNLHKHVKMHLNGKQ